MEFRSLRMLVALAVLSLCAAPALADGPAWLACGESAIQTTVDAEPMLEIVDPAPLLMGPTPLCPGPIPDCSQLHSPCSYYYVWDCASRCCVPAEPSGTCVRFCEKPS